MKNRVLVRVKNVLRVLKKDDITHVVADSDYSFVHMRSGEKIRVHKKVSELIEPCGLIKIHRSYSVNPGAIKHIIEKERMLYLDGVADGLLIGDAFRKSLIEALDVI